MLALGSVEGIGEKLRWVSACEGTLSMILFSEVE